MKIKIILSFILTVLTFGFHAQVQFSEDFTSPWSASTQGWVVINNSLPIGSTNVFQGTNSLFSAYNGTPNDYVAMNYQSASSGGISTWLMTPTLNLANGTTLQFATRVVNPIQYADRLEVRMSTAGSATALASGTTAIGTFTNLLLTINPLLSTINTSVVINNAVNGYPAFWAVYTLSVSGLSGPTVGRFAFRYFVDNSVINANYIGLDAVRVVDPPPAVNPCNSITNLNCSAVNSFSLNAGPGYLSQQPGTEKIYSFTPNLTGNHTLTLNHNSTGSISLYRAQTCNLASWANLGAVTTNSTLTISVTSGVTEYFLIDDGNTTSSSGTIKIDCPAAPPADPCLSITSLTCSVVDNFTLASGSGYLPQQPGREKIYSYTPTSTGNHTLTLNHSSLGSVSLYLDSQCNAGSAWTNIATITSNSSVSVPMTSGVTQYFLIDDDNPTVSPFSITLECAAADPCLSITSLVCESPMSFSLAPGQGAWNTTGLGKEKVYSFTPSLTGQYTLSLSNTGQIDLFSAAACSPSGWAPISSASSGNYTVQLISGVLVYILIDGTDGNLAGGACTIKCPTQDDCTLKNYGASKANNPDDEEIYNVSLGTLDNASSCSTVAPGPNSILKQYSNFTGIVTAPSLVPGELYPLSVTVGECGSSSCSTGGISVYIDYNADGSFSGPGENVWSRQGCSATAAGKTYSTSIAIPNSSPFGYKRMRVIFNCDGLTASTSSYGFGETEDYCVLISPPVGIASETTRKLDVRVSPNPTSGQLNVQLEKNNNYTLHILNTLGQVILSQAADMQTTIDLKDINSGIYFLKVMDKNHTLYTTRIIKE